MRLHRFYINRDLESSGELYITEDEIIHQVRDVFRLNKSDSIILFCGDGFDYVFEIETLSKKELSLKKIRSEKNFVPQKRITLLLALIKKDNFELVLEKATEIGVTHFVPVITERTLSKNINFDRARKIIKEASEQCGRGDVPSIDDAQDLEYVLDHYSDVVSFDITGDVFEVQNQSKVPDRKKEIAILVGPEGGWSEQEIQKFKDRKIKLYKLGDTTLRAETAAIVASAFVMRS